ncbi:esterase/lipase family protein [Tomitella biformata]|uniref:esterase/lipase family protein n=1 Tax=Tomitella biformata TaxID=630403 RepID=UPI00046350EF|nr:alpha/beta fold hydrolase [Tomitella biformata]
MRKLWSTVPILIAGFALVAGAVPAAAEPEAVPGGFYAGYAAEAANPGGNLPGINDWDCKPSAEHPQPVVLVHGLTANRQINWVPMSGALVREGYCVFAPTVGVLPHATEYPLNVIGAVGDMRGAAAELAVFVEQVLAATGAEQVDLVSHSTGTLLAGYYVKVLGGSTDVDNLIALTPVWRGNEAYGAGVALEVMDQLGIRNQTLALWDPICPACLQMAKGSDFMNEITDGGPYAPNVQYTNVMTRYDELVMPYTAGYVEAPNAVNIVLQDTCEQDFSDHVAVGSSVRAQQIVLNTLDPAHAQPVPCVFVPPFVG